MEEVRTVLYVAGQDEDKIISESAMYHCFAFEPAPSERTI